MSEFPAILSLTTLPQAPKSKHVAVVLKATVFVSNSSPVFLSRSVTKKPRGNICQCAGEPRDNSDSPLHELSVPFES